jgi:hypothetical protein
MKLLEKAFNGLFPDKDLNHYDLKIKYTDKFKPYNANVRYRRNSLQFNLSRKWRGVSMEIQMGLIQGLLLKVFKEKKSTMNIDLYNHFLKNLHISAPKTDADPLLEGSFDKLNEKYFLGLMERTNLVWHNSIRRLGSYEYGSDTISLSRVLLEDSNLLDYVMYHEMLHKKFKFNDRNGRTCHHTHEFKDAERKFENSSLMEEKLKGIGRKRRNKLLGWF